MGNWAWGLLLVQDLGLSVGSCESGGEIQVGKKIKEQGNTF